jgi:RNA polymerase sigma-70 factor (ECF subfamily)
LVVALRAGDEAAFVTLIERYHADMLRLAQLYLPDPALAEEIAHEAWLGILRDLDGFQARSSLRTWLFRRVLDGARARASGELRRIPVSAWDDAGADHAVPTVEPERFRRPGDQWPGGWVSFPPSWGEAPEQRLFSGEVRQLMREAIDHLPPAQREVVVLRDVQGWTAQEVCHVLDLSEAHQRLLLQRGRSRLRRELAHHVAGE